MKVFLLANSYTASTIATKLEYVLNVVMEELIILRENYTNSINIKYEKALHIYDTPDECVRNCDIVLIVKDFLIPEKTVCDITALASKLTKSVYLIDNPWTVLKESNTTTQDVLFTDFDDQYNSVPLILVLSCGSFAQSYCVEIMLSEVFLSKQMKVVQFWKPEVEKMLIQLHSQKLLNHDLAGLLKESCSNPDILIQHSSINCFEHTYDTLRLMEYILRNQPDYVILCVNGRIKITEYEYRFFENKYGIPIDLVVQSSFIPKLYIDEYASPLEIDRMDNTKLNIYSTDTISVNQIYEKRIKTKINIPDHVNILSFDATF